ncbi:MAG: adenine phosphoribosyltransferase [Patescibacteria group bacterium]|nr:adenine phosphoribosyltransferase [Patescibacteria group bacterium]
MDTMALYGLIRAVPDFPKKGTKFFDITPALENNESFQFIIKELALPYEGEVVDKVVGIDARGFLLAAPLAFYLGCGLAIVRKKGKLPHSTFSQEYEFEYGSDTIEMHKDAIAEGEKVIIVDDILATGGTMRATVDLVHQFNAEIIGISFLAELSFLHGKQHIEHYPVYSLLTFDE